eukprot:6469901-Amphidinium_carterae.1
MLSCKARADWASLQFSELLDDDVGEVIAAGEQPIVGACIGVGEALEKVMRRRRNSEWACHWALDTGPTHVTQGELSSKTSHPPIFSAAFAPHSERGAKIVLVGADSNTWQFVQQHVTSQRGLSSCKESLQRARTSSLGGSRMASW